MKRVGTQLDYFNLINNSESLKTKVIFCFYK